MKHLVLTVIFSVACACAGAEEVPRLPTASQTGLEAGDAKDWSQTRLVAEPALRGQIARTVEFLDDNATGMDDDINRLKFDGLLDRRSASKIRVALDHARGSMARMAKGIEGEGQLDGWAARMIAYELGMAADALAKQAGPIETELNAGVEGNEEQPEVRPSAVAWQRHLAGSLREASRLLKETAQATVRNLE